MVNEHKTADIISASIAMAQRQVRQDVRDGKVKLDVYNFSIFDDDIMEEFATRTVALMNITKSIPNN